MASRSRSTTYTTLTSAVQLKCCAKSVYLHDTVCAVAYSYGYGEQQQQKGDSSG